jgi:NADH dehydrogenase
VTPSGKRVVVLGGGFAGTLATRRVGRAIAALGGTTTLINASGTFVERVRLHQVATGQAVARPPLESLLAGSAVAVRVGTVTSLDLEAREVHLDAAPGPVRVPFDYLCYAAGSTIDTETVPGVREHALSVGTEASAEGLASRLSELGGDRARVVVCGGGLTGIELATEIAETWPRLRVSLVARGTFGEAFSASGRDHLLRAFQRLRIELLENITIHEVRAREIATSNGAMGHDACVWAAAFRVPQLAREAKLTTNEQGQVLVDPFMRSVSHPEVFAFGDAAIPALVPAARIRMGCATAMPMAAHGAECLLAAINGRTPRPFRFAYAAQFVSLGRRDALAQLVHFDDSPSSFVLTGLVAAWMKEMTFRFNMFSVRTGFYPWRVLLARAPALPGGVRELPRGN